MTLPAPQLKNPPDHWQMPIHTPLGRMTLLANAQGLCGAWFEQQKHSPDLHNMPWGPGQCWLLQAKQQLSEYFSGKRTQFELPLSPFGGSEFQRTVWQALAMIPFGHNTGRASAFISFSQMFCGTIVTISVGAFSGTSMRPIGLITAVTSLLALGILFLEQGMKKKIHRDGSDGRDEDR